MRNILRPFRSRFPTDPLTEDVTVAAAARNQRILFNTRVLAIVLTLLGILGIIPLFTLLAGPWVSSPTPLTREQLLLAFSISSGYVALSILLLFMIISTFSAQSSFNDFYKRYIDLASTQSPLLNVVRHHQFCGEHIHLIAQALAVVNQKMQDGTITADEEKAFLLSFLDTAKQVFGYYCGGKCATCIKMIESDGISQRVFTLARDTQSDFERGHVDNVEFLSSYDISSNTAFREIYDDGGSLLSHFFCNDLRALAAKGEYQNNNPEWSKHYNAAGVVPIKPANVRINSSTIGFLCVDTLSGEFPKGVSISTLQTLAALLYIYFSGKTARNLREQAVETGMEEESVQEAV